MQLKPISVQKEVLALVFSWQLSEIFNYDFFKEKKKHCYKQKCIVIRNMDQVSIANLIMQLLI